MFRGEGVVALGRLVVLGALGVLVFLGGLAILGVLGKFGTFCHPTNIKIVFSIWEIRFFSILFCL